MDPNVTFSAICTRQYRGYTITDTCKELKNATITHSAKMIYEHTNYLFKQIECSGATVGKLTIGKTYVDNIPHVYSEKQQKLPYMMVVAMATEGSIPESCKEDGYIIDAEEYAMKLKDRLQLLYYGERICSVCGPGGARSGNVNNKYVVYVAFTLLPNLPLLPLAILPSTWLCKAIIIIA